MSRGAPPSNPGDWACSSCLNVNFKFRKSCNKCKTPKTQENPKVKVMGKELGEKASEISNGLFSAKDWSCTSCGNINFARRLACNICGVQKFKTIEERSGAGGGYNERYGVEYKESVEEGEYDEFGRKKKKKNSTYSKKEDVSEDSTLRNIERNHLSHGTSKKTIKETKSLKKEFINKRKRSLSRTPSPERFKHSKT